MKDFFQLPFPCGIRGISAVSCIIFRSGLSASSRASFRTALPDALIGRAMTDVQAMSGHFDAPVTEGDVSVLTGTAPVAKMQGYQTALDALFLPNVSKSDAASSYPARPHCILYQKQGRSRLLPVPSANALPHNDAAARNALHPLRHIGRSGTDCTGRAACFWSLFMNFGWNCLPR